MRYEHIRVSTLVDVTDSAAVAKWVEGRWVPLNFEGEESGNVILWNNIPVTKKLRDMATTLQTRMRGIRLGLGNSITIGKASLPNNEWQNVVSDLYVYVPGERYARGLIGFGKFRVSGGNYDESDFQYMVKSSSIRNAKYNQGREQFHMMITSNQDSALRSAMTNLRAYTVPMIASIESEDFCDHLNEAHRKRERVVRTKFDETFHSSTLREELLSLYASGFRFTNTTLNEGMESYLAARAELKEYSQRSGLACFVQVRLVNGEQWVDILHVAGFNKQDIRYGDTTVSEQKTMRGEEVPYDIAAKIATLSMLQDGESVEGVGTKVREDSYWVIQDNQ